MKSKAGAALGAGLGVFAGGLAGIPLAFLFGTDTVAGVRGTGIAGSVLMAGGAATGAAIGADKGHKGYAALGGAIGGGVGTAANAGLVIVYARSLAGAPAPDGAAVGLIVVGIVLISGGAAIGAAVAA